MKAKETYKEVTGNDYAQPPQGKKAKSTPKAQVAITGGGSSGCPSLSYFEFPCTNHWMPALMWTAALFFMRLRTSAPTSGSERHGSVDAGGEELGSLAFKPVRRRPIQINLAAVECLTAAV